MHDQDFSLKEMVKEILKETKEQTSRLTILETKVTSIHDEVRKTNGRVTKIEDKTIPAVVTEVNEIKLNQKGLMVKMAVGVFIASVVVAKVINSV